MDEVGGDAAACIGSTVVALCLRWAIYGHVVFVCVCVCVTVVSCAEMSWTL